MYKKLFFISLVFFASLFGRQAHAITPEEGLLYSAIGCTGVFRKIEELDKVDKMLDFIHNFSNDKGITEVQPGYQQRFIKIVERKWNKDNEMARKNCDGIYGMAENSPKPNTYNAVAQSVEEYIRDIEASKRSEIIALEADKSDPQD